MYPPWCQPRDGEQPSPTGSLRAGQGEDWVQGR